MPKSKSKPVRNIKEVPSNDLSTRALCVGRGEPNATTMEAIRELREGGGIKLTGTIKDLMATLDD